MTDQASLPRSAFGRVSAGAALAALGAAAPLVAHASGTRCWVFLPAHFPTLLAGLSLGPYAGGLVAAATIASDALGGGRLHGIALLPLAVELFSYGLVAGLLALRSRSFVSLWPALLGAMVAGRLDYLTAALVLGRDVGRSLEGLFWLPWPGMALQCLCLPGLAWLLRRSLAPPPAASPQRSLFWVFDDGAADLGARVGALYAVLIAGNLAAWGWALVIFRGNALLMGTALLAYGFGLRHAFDADHIAAIDNVTRKLMQEGKRPVAAGFFFSLGHSTVVVALALGIAATAAALQSHFEGLKRVGGTIGTLVSSGFLFAVAVANAFILRSVWEDFRRVRKGEKPAGNDLERLLPTGGVLTRLLRSFFCLVDQSWHMYPLGFLFGLGFDTATEIGLLGISAAVAAKGMSIWSILVFPALFTAGMSLMDTTDGVLMIGAYGWAFVKPVRKLYYNLTITTVSVVTAVAIGGLEALGLLGDRFGLKGPFWEVVGGIDRRFGLLGFGIVGLFVGSWAISVVIYRLKRFDELDARL